MEAPICCKKPMEVKTAVVWPVPNVYPSTTMGGYNNTLILIYQCKKCGVIYKSSTVI